MEDRRSELSCRLLRLGRSLRPPSRPQAWVLTLVVGLLSYGAINYLLVTAPRLSLVPVSLLLGSFLVPLVVVLFLQESGVGSDVPPAAPTIAFLFGGILGLLGAHLLTPLFFRLPLSRVLMIGASEELAKVAAALAVLVVPGGRGTPGGLAPGLILGASSGLGFAALESMGYGFSQLVESGFSTARMDRVLLVRSLLAPLAHGTWSALVCVGLWEAWRLRTGRAWLGALGLFAVASGLHGLWNLPRLLGEETYRALMGMTVPFLQVPVWHLAVGGFSLVALYLAIRGRLDWPAPPTEEQVQEELERCRALAAGLTPR